MPSDVHGDDMIVPRFSLITAAYNVSPYIRDFVASLERQSIDKRLFELIVIDDGSVDDTREVFATALAGSSFPYRIVTQQNAGQGAARNAAISLAQGEWISFPDPDDWLDDDYLHVVDQWLNEHHEIDMVATNRIIYMEQNGQLENRHALRKFFGRDQIVSLTRFPLYFHGSAPSAFFRMDAIRENEISFDVRIRSNFEDGHFCVQYLLTVDDPVVAFLDSARYIYRRRADNSSTVQRKLIDPGHFIETPRLGYLDALETASRLRNGTVPEWLQNLVLYELSWYFTEDQEMGTPTIAVGSLGAEFRTILAEISGYLSPALVWAFDVRRFPLEARQALVYGIPGHAWMSESIVLDRIDERQGLVRLVYRYTGEAPEVTFESAGRPVEPAFTKKRSIEFFGAEVVTEVISWLTLRHTITVRVGGSGLPIRRGWPGVQRTSLRPAQIRRAFGLSADPEQPKRLRSLLTPQPTRRRRKSWDRRFAESAWAKWRFRRGWVLMDRIGIADDNAEVLFAHLRAQDSKINARFVIERGTPGWRRLRRLYGRRVIAYGSWTWKMALFHADFLISSHAEVPIIYPEPYRRTLGNPRYRFAFLQHGVTKDDLSRWLNPKRIDLLVASTPGEYQAFAGDHTPYNVTPREVQLTGMPRFDALQARRRPRSVDDQPLVLIAPTWRDWLNEKLIAGESTRSMSEGFADTEYAQNWLGLLRAPELHEAARDAGVRVALLPHPNLRRMADHVDIPSEITLFEYGDGRSQQHLAAASLLVTDYSSTAFDVAYLGTPVVYFQFDAHRYLQGAHTVRPGYFDYDRDGFGPRATTLDQAVEEVVKAIRSRFAVEDKYAARMDAAFPNRDGKASERVVRALRQLNKRQ